LYSQRQITINERSKEIRIENRNISKIPDSLFVYKEIESVYISFCTCENINKLISSLSGFANLKRLYFQDVGIKKIPKSIKKLNNLETLSIIEDTLSCISRKIKHTKLTTLIFRNVNLNVLSQRKQNKIFKSISTIKDLFLLDLSDNNMDTLYMNFNKIEISKLFIYNNNFNHIPMCVCNMMNFGRLYEIMIDYSEDMTSEKCCLSGIQKKNRVIFHIYINFPQNTNPEVIAEILLKLKAKYPQINYWYSTSIHQTHHAIESSPSQ